MSDLILPVLERMVEEAIEEFLLNVSTERWERMEYGLQWEETVDGKSIHLEAEVLEKSAEILTICVSASYQHVILRDQEAVIGPGINWGTDFEVPKGPCTSNMSG